MPRPPNQRSVPVQASSQADEFDVKSFCDMTHDFGRAYRNRAIELIRICRSFTAASEQSFRQYLALSSVLCGCDLAVTRAIDARKRTTKEADFYYKKAIRQLTDYASEFHDCDTIAEPMGQAEGVDKQNMNKSRNKADDHNKPVVQFRILGTLPDERPVIVQQALSNSTRTLAEPEILWNFSHFPQADKRRLTLAQNPHFYEDLPKSSDAYGGNFKSRPTEFYKGMVYVITNNSRRVFLEFEGKLRAFDNVSIVDNTLIFKDVAGKLEGETIVGNIEDTPTFWYLMESTTDKPQLTGRTKDWIHLIRTLGDPSYTHIRIRAKTF